MRGAIALLGLAACGFEANPNACEVGADCASGTCRADGTCVPATDAGPADVADDAATGCVPDGRITRDEARLEPGTRARYRVASDAPVATAGTSQPDGTRTWSFADAMAGDHDVDFEAAAPAGTWFAAAFPTATFAAPISEDPDLLGVYRATPSSLLLIGVVSRAAGAGRTELAYDPPVEIRRFPLELAAGWSALANVSGLAGGVPAAYTERFEVAVDAHGTASTPAGAFPVLRVRTVVARNVGGFVTTIRAHQFDAECYGIVATVRSHDNEPSDDFTTAAEVWRLAP